MSTITRETPKTVDQLRANIDKGHTGEKVAFPDPAAAPLGTDAEAGGAPAQPSELAMESTSSRARHRRGNAPGVLLYIAMAGVAAVVIIALVMMGRG